MPVLKERHTRPAMKDAVVLDLGDIGAQAEKLRRAAEAKAQSIIDAAQADADALAHGAEERGHAEGLARGLEEGRQQGLEQGGVEALAELKPRLEQSADALLNVAAQWEASRAELHAEAKQAVLEFALRLAEKVVHRVVQVDGEAVIDQVANALTHVMKPTDVVIRVCPDDVPILEQALPELLKEFSQLTSTAIEPDNDMSPGGCVIAFDGGEVDATLEKQLERIVDVMLPTGETTSEA